MREQNNAPKLGDSHLRMFSDFGTDNSMPVGAAVRRVPHNEARAILNSSDCGGLTGISFPDRGGEAAAHRELFRLLYEGLDGLLELRAIGLDSRGRLTRRQFFGLTDHVGVGQFCRQWQRQELYFGVALRRDTSSGTLKNCGALPVLFVDLDFKNFMDGEAGARSSLAACPLPPSTVVATGGGLHLYWLLRVPISLQADGVQAKRLLEALARALRGDPISAEPAHVLRVPGTLNHKYDPARPVVLELVDPARRYTLDDFDWLPMPEDRPEPVPVVAVVADRERILRRAAAYLAKISPAVEGQHGDDQTYRAACVLVNDFTLADSEAFDLLCDWNRSCQPPWSEQDLMMKIHNARRYADGPHGSKAEDRPQPTRHAPALVLVGTTPDDRLTEAGAAERFARLHGGDVRFDHRRGRYLLWNGRHWTPDVDGGITRLGLSFALAWQRESLDTEDRDRREATFKAALRLERRDALQSMLKLAADLEPIADTGAGWDADPALLGVPNGVVDLRTGALREGQRTDRISLCASAPYDPEACSPKWSSALASILGQEDVIAFVQTALGYCATGDMRRDCWFLTQGPGRNGKGTVAHPVRRALGDYAAELPAAVFDARRDAAPYDLAILPGKRFVVCSEAGDTIRLHHDRIKQITGGDPIRAANKYERSFEFQPTCKLWLSANRKPRVTDDSPAFWARVMLVPFPVSFAGREDRDLRPALEHDPDHQRAILAWLVAGAVRYYRDGLRPPGIVARATTEYQQESDPLADFLAEACAADADSEIGAAEFYSHYRGWADRHGLADRERLSARAFGERAAARFTRVDGRRGRVYRGIGRAC